MAITVRPAALKAAGMVTAPAASRHAMDCVHVERNGRTRVAGTDGRMMFVASSAGDPGDAVGELLVDPKPLLAQMPKGAQEAALTFLAAVEGERPATLGWRAGPALGGIPARAGTYPPTKDVVVDATKDEPVARVTLNAKLLASILEAFIAWEPRGKKEPGAFTVELEIRDPKAPIVVRATRPGEEAVGLLMPVTGI